MAKKLLPFLVIAFALFSFQMFFPAYAVEGPALRSPAKLALSGSEVGWVIESFDADIYIPKDGKVRVVETIVADFGDIQKHGIYRTIETTDMKFDLVGVDQDGAEAITEVSSVSDGKRIRIGDPDKTITGRHTYEIVYEVGRVITRFDDHDEFYWDVTGDGWEVPIEEATAKVTLEGGDVQEVTCYTGGFGSDEQNCLASVSSGRGMFMTSVSLSAYEGLTVAIKIPKDLVADPVYIWDIIKPLWMVLGSLAAVVFVLRRWWRHGRDMWYRKAIILDPKAKPETKPLFAKETTVVQFDPPKSGKPAKELRPAEVGTLIDERVDIDDISATIVDLAVRGYLKIKETKKGRRRKYSFERLKDFSGDKSLVDYEKEVLKGLFERGDKVKLDDLKDKFYKHLKTIQDKLYAKMADDSYFVKRPDKVKLKYIGWGIMISVLSFMAASFTAFVLLWLFFPAMVLGILMLATSPLMPKKTGVGTEMVRRASGFKLFISKAEKHHQEFNERINRFDEFLPYAMVFGVVDKWVKTFEKLEIEPPQPSWYASSYAFNAAAFSSSMRGMNSAFASTLPSTPASAGGGSGFGGGGFSGGGFGGGGGGGW